MIDGLFSLDLCFDINTFNRCTDVVLSFDNLEPYRKIPTANVSECRTATFTGHRFFTRSHHHYVVLLISLRDPYKCYSLIT
jgi:hypothetical protein